MEQKNFSKTSNKISDEVINKVERIDILQVAQTLGLELTKVGKHFRSGKNNAFEFYPDTNRYTNHQTGVKGGNTISLVSYELGLKFPQAVNYLQNLDADVLERPIVKVKKEPYQPTRQPAHDTERLKKHLVEVRGFLPDLVDLLVKKNYIMQDRQNNIVFKWFKNGQMVGADIQGTTYRPNAERPYFKGVDKNSEDFGFNLVIGKQVKDIYTFESPMDGIAFLNLQQKLNNCMIVSTSGTSNPHRVEKFMNYAHINYGYNYGENSVHVSCDNDNAGQKCWDYFENKNEITRKFSEGGTTLFVNNLPKLSQGKDWNEVLNNYQKFLAKQSAKNQSTVVNGKAM